jgi:uncharacterized Zn-binding protein involved in type VI secretion
MFPAARKTDPITHDLLAPAGVIGPPVSGPCPGLGLVMIEGPPAAHVLCTAVCSGATSAGPAHPPLPVPPPIVVGSMTVLIHGMMAARWAPSGDVAACGVFLGDPKLAATRTVLIGGPASSVTVVKRGNIFVIVDRNTHTIILWGIQEFSGTGATQAFVDAATNSINSTWSGTTTFEGQPYTVNSMIVGVLRAPGSSPSPGTNQVNVVQTSVPPNEHKNNDPAHVDGSGNTYLHSNEDDGGTLTIPHEFGHTMGLPDEYTEGPRDANGNRTIVRTGPPGGLMGYIDPGSKPTADNYNSLITGNGLDP